MRVRVINGRDLTVEHHRFWLDLQQSEPAFANPYFCPQFTAAVALVREDVFVGMMEEDDQPVGLFPFQLSGSQVGGPVGGNLSDYQGVLARSDVRWTAEELLRGCGLVRWEFDHLLASQEPFIKFHALKEVSPLIELSDGFEAYAEGLRQSGSKVLKRIGTLKRKLEREVGTVRYEAHAADNETLQFLLGCKAAQYVRTGYASIFEIDWVRSLLEGIHTTQDKDFAGMLSVLYAGEHFVAAHFGMRSRTIWHYWFPSYDLNFAAYSPGLILLLEMARSAQTLDLRAIDLGKGLSPYKQRLMNASVPIAEGIVELPA